MCVSFKIPKVRYRLQFRGQTTHGNREGSVAQVAQLLGAGAGRHALQISARGHRAWTPRCAWRTQPGLVIFTVM